MTLFFILAYFILSFVVPTIVTQKRTGINPITFKNSGSAHDLIGFYMKLTMILSVLAGIETLHLLQFKLDHLFDHEELTDFGILTMTTAMAWTMVAQFQMADSWRIGIDEATKTRLRTTGLFRFSRNPIFLGMILFQIGVFLSHPTSLFLFILVTSFILITIQVRLEESFLLRQHGATYEEFLKRVPRWLLSL